MPKVSIIIPVFNCEAYIEEAVQSILMQTCCDLEAIVVNDGSTDHTLEIVNRLAAKDSRIRIFSQENSGRPAIARNVGLRHANGAYITFLDGDDIYHADKIKREVSVLDQFSDIDMVFADIKRFEFCPEENGSQTYLKNENFLDKAKDYLIDVGEGVYLCRKDFYTYMSTQLICVTTQTLMLRRSLLMDETIWFNEGMRVGEDVDLWFRLSQRAHLAYIDEVLCYYRQRSDSLSHDLEESLIGGIDAGTKNLQRSAQLLSCQDINKLKLDIACKYFDLGYLYAQQYHKGKAREAYLNSLQMNFNYKTLMALLKTILPTPVSRLRQK